MSMQVKNEFLVGTDFAPDPTEEIMPSLFQEYERIMVESLIASFGLDFLVNDQHGGDVDTILNVRKIGQDPQMQYKSIANQKKYEQREIYDPDKYHKDEKYIARGKEVKAQKKAGTLTDAYTGNRLARNANVDIDHVISAKEIADDRGRVLSGLDGVTLANQRENLQPTDRSINRSMKEKSIEEYIKWLHEKEPERAAQLERLHGKPETELTDKERKTLQKYEQQAAIDQERMRQCDSTARKAYNARLARAYYSSPQFAWNMAKAAGNVSLRMGARQVCGFIFAEMWFSVKEEFQQAGEDSEFDLATLLNRIGNGLKRGWEQAKEKYKTLIDRALSGAVAGFFSSITTTLCNIFFTTAKHTARIIRQSYASLVEAAKVLFINPECYTFGERMQAVAKILATGASVVTGTMVSELIDNTAIGTLPVLGEAIQSFCGAFVGGIMSCTFLYLFDRSEIIKKLVQNLDNIHTIETEVQYFRQQADYFERYAAELMDIDLKKFQEEASLYWRIAALLENTKSAEDLNSTLKNAYQMINATIPWQGYECFNDFMQDKSAQLVFE